MAHLTAEDLGWDRPLRYRLGSPKRLDGIGLYYDFKWYDLFPSGRAQFKNGLSLARLVRTDCPASKVPALLLTTRDDVAEEPIQTAADFVVVLHLPRYLAQATPDAAASYYAHHLKSGITGIAHLQELASRPDVIEAVVDLELNANHIETWVAGNAERLDQLRQIAGGSESSREPAGISDVIAALRALEGLDAELVEAIAALIAPSLDVESRIRLLRALTEDSAGRYLASDVLGQRITERLADARAATEAYTDLLADSSTTETDLQKFIERNPWLLGLEYVHVRHRRALPRGAMDFILERYDGIHDLLELKSPRDEIIEAPDEIDGVPPPASQYTLSPDLALALAQVHVYRDVLSTDTGTVDKLYGLRNTREPRVIIVIGQASRLPPHRARVLRELNLSLHRVEIAPYDVLAARATTVLDNVERHLLASHVETEADDPMPEDDEAA